jgi:Ca2+:H+ antiporter
MGGNAGTASGQALNGTIEMKMQQQPSVAALSPHSGSGLSLMGIAQREWPLLGSIATAAAFLFFGQRWLADLSNPIWLAFLLLWLFGVVLFSALAVVRHAEVLAVKLGEPLGTLVLTLSVAGIEIMMIAAIMYTAEGGSSLARDTMFAAVMIVMNGMIGLSLLLGGLRYHEQTYNLQGANAFLAVIVPLAVLSLILPTFTTSSPGPTLSPFQAIFHIVMSVGLYGVFLAIQNLRHRNYFVSTDPDEAAAGPPHAEGEDFGRHTVSYHTLLLLMYLAPVIILSKQMAVPINFAIREWHLPSALGGLLVAVLILAPESLGAARAALANQLQRSVNVLLGSVLATISLTIPAVLTIGFLTNKTIILGLGPVDMTMLLLTLGVSTLTFGRSRTNVLVGIVHLLLFLAYLMLIFER